ncbi:hypothetical protein FO519_008406 [Halicephalobus sp. NKZ332]|nr:hypothetical protein FO519_008406 [Halicephalobus sp. NKZ332]
MFKNRNLGIFTTKRFSSGFCQLYYEGWGDPQEVIKIKYHEPLKVSPKGDQVHVKFQAAPINPADINQIQGVYAVKPSLPATGGNEGYGIVEAVGPGVKTLKPGDFVIPAFSGFGTWRSEALESESKLYKIDNRIPKHFAATLQVNPCTAYRMLADFVKLNKSDVVVQNGANSAVGKYVIQIGKLRGLKTINVVRNRPNIDELKKELTDLGADQVLTEEEFVKSVKGIKSKLALNCVGGRSSLMIARTLKDEGVMVTYGGMSKQPVQGATGPFIFNDISFRGFWMSMWYDKAKDNPGLSEKRRKMYDEIGDWIANKELHPPKIVERKPEDFKNALLDATSSADAKQLFVFN